MNRSIKSPGIMHLPDTGALCASGCCPRAAREKEMALKNIMYTKLVISFFGEIHFRAMENSVDKL